ncbi:MAG TPA: hypothetical protein ENO19_01075 [Halothiobacillaceae bacterium]|nr:hypothetical protein [Halothiobacillaceae bacterium]
MPQATQNIDRPLILDRNRLGDFSVPAASGRDKIHIDTAKNVHGVYLYLTIAGVAATEAEIKAQVGTIRVYVGSVMIWELTATEILDLFHYYTDKFAVFTVAGVLPLRFTPFMLPLNESTRSYALGMLNDRDPSKRNTFEIEVNMTAGPITIDACEVHLETDQFPSMGIGYHTRWLRYGSTWAAASKQTLDKIPVESNCLAAYGYHFNEAQTISRVNLKVNDVVRINDQPNDLLLQKLHEAGRIPQTGYTHLDFSLENDPRAFLDLSRLVNQYLDVTWAVAPAAYDLLLQKLFLNLN